MCFKIFKQYPRALPLPFLSPEFRQPDSTLATSLVFILRSAFQVINFPAALERKFVAEMLRKQMRNLIALTGILIFSCGNFVVGADVANKGQIRSIITNVLIQKKQDGLKYAHIVIDDEKIQSVNIYGFQYLSAIKKIDVKRCPKKFRLAWSGYIAAWQKKLNQEHATEETADSISMWKGDFKDLSATVSRIEAYDTDKAWQTCERVALDYGVKAS